MKIGQSNEIRQSKTAPGLRRLKGRDLTKDHQKKMLKKIEGKRRGLGRQGRERIMLNITWHWY